MRLKTGNGLIPINLLVIALIVVIALFPDNVLRVILGLPFLLFFPGYILLAALYPEKEKMNGPERLALSCGLSVAIVVVTRLIFSSFPWWLQLEVTLYSTTAFILVTSIIAWLRGRRLPEAERFRIGLTSEAPKRRAIRVTTAAAPITAVRFIAANAVMAVTVLVVTVVITLSYLPQAPSILTTTIGDDAPVCQVWVR
ncbi:DUF1616 domain-containing protein [Chloroflexota bacterium]